MEEIEAYLIRGDVKAFIKKLKNEGFSVSKTGRVSEKNEPYEALKPLVGHFSESIWHGWRDNSVYLVIESKKFLNEHWESKAVKEGRSRLIRIARNYDGLP
jgi:hypothetical protein